MVVNESVEETTDRVLDGFGFAVLVCAAISLLAMGLNVSEENRVSEALHDQLEYAIEDWKTSYYAFCATSIVMRIGDRVVTLETSTSATDTFPFAASMPAYTQCRKQLSLESVIDLSPLTTFPIWMGVNGARQFPVGNASLVRLATNRPPANGVCPSGTVITNKRQCQAIEVAVAICTQIDSTGVPSQWGLVTGPHGGGCASANLAMIAYGPVSARADDNTTTTSIQIIVRSSHDPMIIGMMLMDAPSIFGGPEERAILGPVFLGVGTLFFMPVLISLFSTFRKTVKRQNRRRMRRRRWDSSHMLLSPALNPADPLHNIHPNTDTDTVDSDPVDSDPVDESDDGRGAPDPDPDPDDDDDDDEDEHEQSDHNADGEPEHDDDDLDTIALQYDADGDSPGEGRHGGPSRLR